MPYQFCAIWNNKISIIFFFSAKIIAEALIPVVGTELAKKTGRKSEE